MKAKFLFALFFWSSIFLVEVLAQPKPRVEDHFWRRKVVNRIDLEEKVNRPLINKESSYYRGGEEGDQYTNKDGIVAALFDGLKENKYTAYDPQDLTKPLVWDDVVAEMNQLDASAMAETTLEDEAEVDMGLGDPEDGFESFPGDETTGADPFFDPFSPPEDGGAIAPEEELTDDLGTTGEDLASAASNDMPNLIPYETVIQFVEDRIFDKNRSDMVYEIQYIEIIWVDPYGTLEDKVVCSFRYDQVLETLDQVQWKNRYNDAQYRSMREVFEMRMFHSFVIDISGVGIQSLAESEYRRQQLVEFEHHLWSY